MPYTCCFKVMSSLLLLARLKLFLVASVSLFVRNVTGTPLRLSQ